jgi:uncharacterized RmlC-like cupin family protein
MKIGDVTCPDCNAGFRPARAFISDGKRILEMVATGEKVCLNVLPMPPGAKAKVHYHKGIETIAYLLEGECSVYYGDELEYRVVVQAGDQIYMPEDVPHAPYNQGAAPCKWLVVHSSGSDQDGIVLLPELDLILARK